MTAIREDNPQTFISARDIHNKRISTIAEFLDGRSPIEALLDELSSLLDWVFDVKLDTKNHVQYLFFTHEK
jgi:hypothetical protein